MFLPKSVIRIWDYGLTVMTKALIFIAAGMFSLFALACSGNSKAASADQSAADSAASVTAASFCADSAYAYVKAQCGFGPRIPGSKAHAACAAFITSSLQGFCDTVVVQKGEVTAFNGKALPITNIIGSFNPQNQQRILLIAHWDSRPWADNDPDEANHSKPVMGANDGASGVGVLIEVARQLAANRPSIGVDILLVDAEDSGTINDDDSWGLGAQYWAKNPHTSPYKPMFGILLDMVGGPNARFSREYFSMSYAASFVNEVWSVAAGLGLQSYFVNENGGGVTDDHVFINKAGIPCIDIIDMPQGSSTGFFPQWHTVADDMAVIDKTTLDAVGRTITTLIAQYRP